MRTSKSSFGLFYKVLTFALIVSSLPNSVQFASAVTSASTATSAASLTALPAPAKSANLTLTGIDANGMPIPNSDPYTATSSGVIDYFGTQDRITGYATGNYANSPLPVSVMIQGSGVGAFYTADYSTDGKIIAFHVVNQGGGYGVNHSATLVSVIGGGGTGATGTPTIDPTTGAITSISVFTQGSGYGSDHGIRKFVSALPDLPIAKLLTGSTSLAIGTPGTAGYVPAADMYEIAAIRSQWQYSVDLPYTSVNMYVQIDPSNYSDPANHISCPTGEVALYYQATGGGWSNKPIANLASHQVCAIATNLNSDGSIADARAPFRIDGPVISAQKDRPVRVTFDNYLPTGNNQCTTAGGTVSNANDKTCGGDLFLPVDSTIMGAGAGPNGGFYSTARATIHLHGGVTPWISDGTMDQWTTPVGANEQYPRGVSMRTVPDMWYDAKGQIISDCLGKNSCVTTGAVQDPGKGRMNFYYTNQQSARLMFYHDHSAGITRLNVYAGLLAGYVLHDQYEGAIMAAAGVRSAVDSQTVNSAQEKVLIIQDKTFVGGPSQMTLQDPTWNNQAWGGEGSLWYPHVYEPNQNPALTPANSSSPGASPTGRWDYGLWFWPAFTTVMKGEVANPKCPNGVCSGVQYKTIPGVPDVSAVPEAFTDVVVINGVAYPVATWQPKVYRLQIVNASNDRTFDLALYYAKSSSNNANTHCTGPLWNTPGVDTTPYCGDSGEVSMVPATVGTPGTAGLVYPDQFQDHAAGVPDMRLAGPSFVELATDGGVLPDPVAVAPNPVGFQYSRQSVTTTNVVEHSLIVGPAQRTDVLVDLTKVAPGSSLILYNDAPAPFPGFDPRNDYYTGNFDQTANGGAPTTIAGYAPNTRTLMQINITANTGATGNGLDASAMSNIANAMHTAYRATQEAPIVPQAAYNNALGTNYVDSVSSYPTVQTNNALIATTGVGSIAITDTATVGTKVITGSTPIPTVVITGGAGNGARARAVVSKSGTIASVNTVTTAPFSSSSLATTTVSVAPPTSGRTAVLRPSVKGSDNLSGGVAITNPGDGYVSTPNVTVTGNSTAPAVAHSVLKGTSIAGIQVTSGGSYVNTPLVSIDGSNTLNGVNYGHQGAADSAYATMKATPLQSITVLNGGSYTAPPVLSISGNSGAAATAHLATSIASLTVTNPGSCTVVSPTSRFNADVNYFSFNYSGGGTPTSLPQVEANTEVVTVNGVETVMLRSVSLLNGGAGFESLPAVLVNTNGLNCTTSPTVTARLAAGPITSVTITNAGSFTSDPQVTASGNGGATFAISLVPTAIASVSLTGASAADYTSSPVISFTSTMAQGAAVVSIGGGGQAFAWLNPTTLDPVNGVIVDAANPGVGYVGTPVITIDAPTAAPTGIALATTANPVQATAIPQVVSGPLQLEVIDPGSGYTSAPAITISGGSGAATATAVMGTNTVSRIDIVNAGSGYIDPVTNPNTTVAPVQVALNYADGTTVANVGTVTMQSTALNLTYQPKAIHELFENMYGRMDSVMGNEVPNTTGANQTTIPWTSADSPTEVINTNAFDVLTANGGNQVDSLPDGTQIWRFTHNGVDTHFLHFHMFNVQVLWRLQWDGINQPLSADDLGWRDTVQFDPLTILYVAIKPIVPQVPFQIPNSIRPLSPSDTFGSVSMNLSQVDPNNTPITQANILVNFGWEYMIHCHLLDHEENDMMRPVAVGVVLASPTLVSVTANTTAGGADINFIDNSNNETGFIVQRRSVDPTDPTFGIWSNLGQSTVRNIFRATATNTILSIALNPASWDPAAQKLTDPGASVGGHITYTDTTAVAGKSYEYRVVAADTIGNAAAGLNFPVSTIQSDPSDGAYIKL
jgi:FtsP/CotA-like multicopper oxidase with cupredoxin domain